MNNTAEFTVCHGSGCAPFNLIIIAVYIAIAAGGIVSLWFGIKNLRGGIRTNNGSKAALGLVLIAVSVPLLVFIGKLLLQIIRG